MSLSVATITTLSLLPPALLWAAPAAYRRLLLSRAKHRSLTGHSRMAQRVARLLPGYQLDEQRFFVRTVVTKTSKRLAERRFTTWRRALLSVTLAR